MLKGRCAVCKREGPIAEMVALDESPMCRPCAELHVREAEGAGRQEQFSTILDPTICGMCQVDYGSNPLPRIGGLAVCGNCAKGLYERPYPAWLRLSLAGLLLLLAVALWRGTPYFKAGRRLVLAERAMEAGDYKAASFHFAAVLAVSPKEQKVLELGAKASLMTGDVAQAQKFLEQRQNYETSDLFTEVKGLWQRALDAYEKASQARKLADEHHDQEAARLMHEASQMYPQSKELALSAIHLDGAVAFDDKDYDSFLRISRDLAEKDPTDPAAVATVASALACKYATAGDPEWRRQSEQMLEKARLLAERSPQDKTNFEEYDERIRYRLATRNIIDKEEYDRRFRQKEARR